MYNIFMTISGTFCNFLATFRHRAIRKIGDFDNYISEHFGESKHPKKILPAVFSGQIWLFKYEIKDLSLIHI